MVTANILQRIVGVKPRTKKAAAKEKACNVIIAKKMAISRANAHTIVAASAMQMGATSGEAILSGWDGIVRMWIVFGVCARGVGAACFQVME